MKVVPPPLSLSSAFFRVAFRQTIKESGDKRQIPISSLFHLTHQRLNAT